MFPGNAGCDVVEGYEGEVEGVWIKDLDGLISFSPDRSHFGYPCHYGLEWLRNKAIDGLSVTFISKSGPYDLVKVTLDAPDVRQVSVILQQEYLGGVSYMSVPRAGSLNWVYRKAIYDRLNPSRLKRCLEWLKLPYERLLVHHSILENMRPTFEVKSGSGHTLDTAIAYAKLQVFNDPVMKEVGGRYPAFTSHVVVGTANAAVFSTKVETARRYQALRGDMARSEAEIVEARAPVFSVTPRKLMRIVMSGLLVSIIFSCGLAVRAHGHILSYTGEVAQDPEWWGAAVVLGVIFLGLTVRHFQVQYRRTGLFGPWLARRGTPEGDCVVGYEVLTAGTSIPALNCTSMATEVACGSTEIWVDGIEMSAAEAFDVLSDDEVVTVSYAIAVTNGMLCQPAKSDVNLLSAIVQRQHVGVVQADVAEWKEVSALVNALIPDSCVVPWELKECAEALGGAKAKNLIESGRQLEDGEISRHRKRVTVKWNETICLKEINGEWTVKPRGIVVLSNELHALFAPTARGLYDALHTIFDGKLFDGVRVYSACGYHGEQLDEIGSHLYALEDTIAASGDDSICCMMHKFMRERAPQAFYPVVEGDFGSMDQSEKIECLSTHGFTMERLGIWRFVVDLFLEICAMGYVARGKRLFMRGKTGAQLATGIDFTTAINTLTTLCFLLWVYFNDGFDPEATATRLGLKLKLKQHCEPRFATFLKGWWLPRLGGGVSWYPLPSQVVKLGKSMRNPRLYSQSHDDYDGVLVAAWALAKSMPNLPRDYPLLGPFVSMLERCGRESKIVLSSSEDGWYKPNCASGPIDRVYALETVCSRYDVTSDEVAECEAMMHEVKRLPVFLSHRVFLQLSNVDYN